MVKARLEVPDLTGGLNSPYGVVGIKRKFHARACFLNTDLCRFIEKNRMSYWTDCETISKPVVISGGAGVPLPTESAIYSVIAVYLNITDEQFTLLKMKLDDPTKLTVVKNARNRTQVSGDQAA